MDVDQKIDEMKQAIGISSDEDLARVFAVGRSTVTSWRRRNRIPARYVAHFERIVALEANEMPASMTAEIVDRTTLGVVVRMSQLPDGTMRLSIFDRQVPADGGDDV